MIYQIENTYFQCTQFLSYKQFSTLIEVQIVEIFQIEYIIQLNFVVSNQIPGQIN